MCVLWSGVAVLCYIMYTTDSLVSLPGKEGEEGADKRNVGKIVSLNGQG